MMATAGRVHELWRYPVKGMAGERLSEATVGANGIAGDRQWAVRETARREIQSCKRHPRLLECVARCEGAPEADQIAPVCIRFPDGSQLSSADPEVHARLSRLLGTEVTLERLRPASELDFYRRYNRGGDAWREDLAATFAREPGEPLPDFFAAVPDAVKQFASAPGRFFLVEPLHLLTTATLRQLRLWNGASDWDARRFRPNLLIETEPSVDGLVEQSWIGRRLIVGALEIECVSTTPRCGAITRAQGGLPFDAKLLRTVVHAADQNVGIYGVATQAKTVRAGDGVAVA